MFNYQSKKSLRREITRLQGVIKKQLIGDITIDDLRGNNNELSLSLSGSPMHIFADAFVEQFSASGATNFLTVSFVHADSNEMFEVTMQKVSGETVVEQLQRLRNELSELKPKQLNAIDEQDIVITANDVVQLNDESELLKVNSVDVFAKTFLVASDDSNFFEEHNFSDVETIYRKANY